MGDDVAELGDEVDPERLLVVDDPARLSLEVSGVRLGLDVVLSVGEEDEGEAGIGLGGVTGP